MATKKYYRIDGTIEDTDQVKSSETLKSINKKMQQEKPAMVSVAQTVKPIQTIDTVTNYKQTQNNLKNAENELKIANDRYQNALSNKLKENNTDYKTTFDNITNKKISYQTKKEDKPKTQPTVIPIQEANKDLQNEINQRQQAYDQWKIANYQNNIAKVNQEDSTLFDKTLGTPIRAVIDLLSPITTGEDIIIKDEQGNKTFLPSYNEIKQQKVKDDTKGIGGIAQDIGYNATKILGAGALDLVSGGIGGKALYWTDMAEDNFKNVKNQGYSNEQAITNTIIATGSEFLTEKLLGGLSKNLTGGKASEVQNVVSNTVSKLVKNPKVANVLGSMTSEGLEEFTQEYIGALNNAITLGKEVDLGEVTKDAFYSALVGAGSGGLVTSVNNADGRNTQNNLNYINQTIDSLEQQKANLTNSDAIKNIDEAINEAQSYVNNPFTKSIEETYSNIQNKYNQAIESENQAENISNNTKIDETPTQTPNEPVETKEQVNMDEQIEKSTPKKLTLEERKELKALREIDEAFGLEENEQKRLNDLQERAEATKPQKLDEKTVRKDVNNLKDVLPITKKATQESLIRDIQELSTRGDLTLDDVKDVIEKNYSKEYIEEKNKDIQSIKSEFRHGLIKIPQEVKGQLNDGYTSWLRNENKGRIKVSSNEGQAIDSAYQEYSEKYPQYFPSNITSEVDQLNKMLEVAKMSPLELTDVNEVSQEDLDTASNYIYEALLGDTELENVQSQELEEKMAEEPVLEIRDDGKVKLDEGRPDFLRETPKKVDEKQLLKESWREFKRGFVDRGEEIKRIAKKAKNKTLYHLYDRMGISPSEAQFNIGRGQTNLDGIKYKNFKTKEGKNISMSIEGIWKDANNSNIDDATLNDYLIHQLNLDRLNNSVDQFNIPAYESSEFIEKTEKSNPEIKRVAENVWQYQKNQLQKMVEGGLITSEQAEQFLKDTPHYVRIQRDVQKSNQSPIWDDFGNLRTNNQIQEVKGGTQDILPIKETMAEYTNDVTNAIRRNIFAKELSKTLGTGEESDLVALDNDLNINPELLSNKNGNYTLTFFDDGKSKTIPIDEGIYDALKPNNKFDIERTLPARALQKLTSVQRSLLTDKNPLFLATNFLKDIGDAPLNSKYGIGTFYKNYLRAIGDKTVIKNYSELYQALGGNQNTYFEKGEFTNNKKANNVVSKGFKATMNGIEKANNFIEQLPRITEFMTTIEKNGYKVNENGELVAIKGKNPSKSSSEVLTEAMYNAAEITTNFKRGGDITKALNRNGATFLNASVQGFSKQIRNFSEIDNPKAAVMLLTKALVLGVAPQVINDLIYEDDDEYKDFQDYIRDGYYLFKTKNGDWVRIPKGRAISVIQSGARRVSEIESGEKTAKEAFKGYGNFINNQIAPNNIAESNVLSPITGVLTNKSWSGNKIVSDSMEDKLEAEQYNEKTDEFSKWLGKQLNVSPMKINYLVDQYSGGVGDIILPQITPKATSKTTNPLITPFASKFTVDSEFSNKSVGTFYDTLKQTKKQKNSINASFVDKKKNSYMDSKNKQLSELYKQQREIQLDSTLDKKDKYEQAREIQKEINDLAKQAVKDVKNVKTGKNYYKIGDYYYYKYQNKDGEIEYRKANDEQIEKHKYALVDYFESLYEKSKGE